MEIEIYLVIAAGLLGAGLCYHWLTSPTVIDITPDQLKLIDGDTVIDRTTGRRFRLMGIDAPEMTQAEGPLALRFLQQSLSRLHPGDTLELRCRGRDAFGRTLAALVAVTAEGEIDFNELMVLRGYARAYRRYSRRYLRAEKIAKHHRRGLWTNGKFEHPERTRFA